MFGDFAASMQLILTSCLYYRTVIFIFDLRVGGLNGVLVSSRSLGARMSCLNPSMGNLQGYPVMIS